MQHVDAAVVGAGIAGLAVADRLCAAGRHVVVLEARSRVGGRLLSHYLEGSNAALDLGATWFWPGEARVAELVRRFDIDVHTQYLDGDAMFDGPEGPQRISGNPIDVPSGRFVAGAASLADALAAQLADDTVVPDATVSSITVVSDGVAVEHARGSVHADQVVLALPPALAVDTIAFEPALPDRVAGLADITPVWMGAIAKVVAVYPHAFWRDRGLAGAAISHVGPLNEIHDMSGPDGSPAALFGFARLADDAPTPTAAEVVAHLTRLFGPDAAHPVEVIIHDWRHEPATSPTGVAARTSYQAFGHPLFGEPTLERIHWASTETSPIAPGHIEGALAAAERAAASILQRLPRHPTTTANREATQ